MQIIPLGIPEVLLQVPQLHGDAKVSLWKQRARACCRSRAFPS
jgi:hypothetical protein